MTSIDQFTALEKKLTDRTCLVGVIGLGYVGLPLSLTFLRKGVKVIGFDLDQSKIDKLSRGESYIKHIPSEELTRFVKQGEFSASNDFARLNEPDCLLICVPTPLTKSREPNLEYI